VAACAALAPGAAVAGYEESHVTGDDVRVLVQASGTARIQHSLTWRIVAGQPRSLDFSGVEQGAHLDPSASVVAEDGRSTPATLIDVPGKGLRVVVSEPKALHHGQQYRVDLAYSVDLIEAGELRRQASGCRLAWLGPAPSEGYDAARVTFVLPPGGEAPSPLIGDEGMPDDGVTATVRRAVDHDEVELVRPHIGRGERVPWMVRVAPQAFGASAGGPMAEPPPPARHAPPATPGLLAYALMACLGVVVAAAVWWRERRTRAGRDGRGGEGRGLVPLRTLERAAAAGSTLFVAMCLQLGDCLWTGTLVALGAMACTVLRPPREDGAARGPGRWLILRAEDVFGRDGATTRLRRGLSDLGAFAAAVGAFWLAGRLLSTSIPDAKAVLGFDAFVLFPAFLTGGGWGSDGRNAWLQSVLRRLQRDTRLRVSVLARIPTGCADPDEVRILLLPHDPMPGLAAIEVGLTPAARGGALPPVPEVLVRVHEATAAGAFLASFAPGVTPVPGRKAEEKVHSFSPQLPTGKAAAALARQLALGLRERREVEAEVEHEDRRGKPVAEDTVPTAMEGAAVLA
jgi:hypothetical protein